MLYNHSTCDCASMQELYWYSASSAGEREVVLSDLRQLQEGEERSQEKNLETDNSTISLHSIRNTSRTRSLLSQNNLVNIRIIIIAVCFFSILIDAPVALKLLVSRLVACSARIVADTQTHRHTERMRHSGEHRWGGVVLPAAWRKNGRRKLSGPESRLRKWKL